LIALGAFLTLVQAANAADLRLRPRPVPRPAAENRIPPAQQQQMRLEEIFPWLRRQR
jgi:hypothetical protein